MLSSSPCRSSSRYRLILRAPATLGQKLRILFLAHIVQIVSTEGIEVAICRLRVTRVLLIIFRLNSYSLLDDCDGINENSETVNRNLVNIREH